MKFNNLFALAIVAVALEVASALTEEEKNNIRESAIPFVKECEKEFGVTKEDLLAAKKTGNVDAIDSCFYACFFKKIGIINEKGLFDTDAAIERNKKYVKGEEDIQKFREITQTCSAVNEDSVSDGEKGCDRAKLLLTCLIKEKGSLGPIVP